MPEKSGMDFDAAIELLVCWAKQGISDVPAHYKEAVYNAIYPVVKNTTDVGDYFRLGYKKDRVYNPLLLVTEFNRVGLLKKKEHVFQARQLAVYKELMRMLRRIAHLAGKRALKESYALAGLPPPEAMQLLGPHSEKLKRILEECGESHDPLKKNGGRCRELESVLDQIYQQMLERAAAQRAGLKAGTIARLREALKNPDLSSTEKDILDRTLRTLKGEKLRPSPRHIQRPWSLADRGMLHPKKAKGKKTLPP